MLVARVWSCLLLDVQDLKLSFTSSIIDLASE